MATEKAAPAETERKPLTVETAADLFEGLFSEPGETKSTREPAAPKAAPSEEDADETPADEAEPQQDAGTEEAADEPADEPAEEGAEAEAPQTFRVKVDGQEVEVTLDELQKGYSRQADYTRKTMQLAEQRKAAEAELATVREQRATYDNQLKAVQEALQQMLPQEPDWQRIRRDYPDQYAQAWAAWSQHQEQVRLVAAERQRVAHEQEQDQLRLRREFVAKEMELLAEAVPEWKDDTKRSAEQKSLAEYGQRLGFTPDELSQVSDHRAILLLRKAMLYDQLQAQKPKLDQVVQKVKTATPGTAKPKSTAQKEYVAARQKLAKSGHIDDAARVLMQILDD